MSSRSWVPRLVVLDRDGVINVEREGDYVRSVEAFLPIEGAIEAIARLSRAGLPVYVATNQSGIGQGLYSEADLADIHGRLVDLVGNAGGSIEAILHCPHLRDAGCACRKPAPGMLLEIARRSGVPVESILFVGDAATDCDAAQRAGCRFALVLTGKGQGSQESVAGRTEVVCADLPGLAGIYAP